MDRLGVTRGRLAATSAARDAVNGGDFLSAAGAVTGLRPELLTGVDEGRLSLAGAVADLDLSAGPFLVLDIGGGSTELVAGDGPDDPDLAAVSLQIGCVRLSERFLVSDPPTADELAAAGPRSTRSSTAPWPNSRASTRTHRLVGLAGTGRRRSSPSTGPWWSTTVTGCTTPCCRRRTSGGGSATWRPTRRPVAWSGRAWSRAART